MKKILILIFALLGLCIYLQAPVSASQGISFIYINGSNNNDDKMKNWYERGVKNLHPHMKRAFETDTKAVEYFLEDGNYHIQPEPIIFFWGFKSRNDLNFVEKNLAISKGFSSWLAYQIRYMLTKFLHDAIWVQKYHNMDPILDDLQMSVMAEHENGNKVVLFGYSAGSFVTYEYLLTKLSYIKLEDFFKNINLTKSLQDFVTNSPRQDTCMDALGHGLAVFSISGHVIPNPNEELFKQAYMKLDETTEAVCTPQNTIRGIVNFASPLVLFYSDLSDPNFDLTYYNRLLFKYILENDMFWITVNYRNDPLGFPGGKNLTVEEFEDAANININPGEGFIYDQSNTWGRNSALASHTSYWATRKIFSKAVVRAYVNGYTKKNDDSNKSKKEKKNFPKNSVKP